MKRSIRARNVVSVIVILISIGSTSSHANPLSNFFSGKPSFGLTKFLGKPFEEFRVEAGKQFISKPMSAQSQKTWECASPAQCKDMQYLERGACFDTIIEGIENNGKLVYVGSDSNHNIVKCGRIPQSLGTVKDLIGSTRAPDVIIKNEESMYGAFLSAVWIDGDSKTKVDAICPVIDRDGTGKREPENFRNCIRLNYFQVTCTDNGCKDISSYKKEKQFPY